METRPTSDRLRETLFNVLAPRLGGARFLDLYAGSGANGLEALSRGAREAVLVEQASPAIEAIRRNVTALGISGRARVEQVSVLRWLGNAAHSVQAFEAIVLDPPYDSKEEYGGALGLLGGSAASLVAPDGVVVAEHRRQRASRGSSSSQGPGLELAETYGVLERFRALEQGDAALSFYALRRT